MSEKNNKLKVSKAEIMITSIGLKKRFKKNFLKIIILFKINKPMNCIKTTRTMLSNNNKFGANRRKINKAESGINCTHTSKMSFTITPGITLFA